MKRICPTWHYSGTAMALILFSFGISFNTVIPPLLIEKMFGSRDFSSIYGLVASAACLGFGIGTALYGMSFDKTSMKLPRD